jgi:uncharacterized protein YbgA (DUF1722 family)/uncharacterized protein YbbK (DUF523 family)
MSGRGREPVASGGHAPGPVRVLVSSCLLGEKVRYDGGHKRDPFLAETLGRVVEYVPVCPEVECGLPVPREAMRLAGDPAGPRLLTAETGVDHTARMARFVAARLRALAPIGLCGYVCKKGSPSCGRTAGLFTRAFMARFPFVPVEEEGRLQAPVLREAFVEKVFTMKRFRDAEGRGGTRGALVAFHTDHKLLLLAHGRPAYAEMGRLVARAKELPAGTLFARYRELLLKALSLRATRAKRSDVLLHMLGHLKRELSAAEKRGLLELIDRYRLGLAPLLAPMTRIRECARRYGVTYLARQAVLDPHPAELSLLEHV